MWISDILSCFPAKYCQWVSPKPTLQLNPILAYSIGGNERWIVFDSCCIQWTSIKRLAKKCSFYKNIIHLKTSYCLLNLDFDPGTLLHYYADDTQIYVSTGLQRDKVILATRLILMTLLLAFVINKVIIIIMLVFLHKFPKVEWKFKPKSIAETHLITAWHHICLHFTSKQIPNCYITRCFLHPIHKMNCQFLSNKLPALVVLSQRVVEFFLDPLTKSYQKHLKLLKRLWMEQS